MSKDIGEGEQVSTCLFRIPFSASTAEVLVVHKRDEVFMAWVGWTRSQCRSTRAAFTRGWCFIVQELDEKLDRTIVTNHTWGIIMCGQLIAFNLIWQKSGVGCHILCYLLTLFLWQLVVGRIWSRHILESNLQTSLLNIGVWVFLVTLTNVSSDQSVHIVHSKPIASRSGAWLADCGAKQWNMNWCPYTFI